MGPPYGKLPILFPYHSHTIPIRIPKEMGIVWEAYHKQVPLLGVPENPIDSGGFIFCLVYLVLEACSSCRISIHGVFAASVFESESL